MRLAGNNVSVRPASMTVKDPPTEEPAAFVVPRPFVRRASPAVVSVTGPVKALLEVPRSISEPVKLDEPPTVTNAVSVIGPVAVAVAFRPTVNPLNVIGPPALAVRSVPTVNPAK